MRALMALAAALILTACAGHAETEVAQPKRQPNVIVILVDDLGYGDLSTYGGWIPTPHITALAASGARFTEGYVSAAVCAPSRAALLTGRPQTRFGFEFNPVGRDATSGLSRGETLMPQVMKQAGYATGMVGKWHIGSGPGFHPLDRGFDSYFGILGGAGDFWLEQKPGDIHAAIDGDQLTVRSRMPVVRGREPVTETRYLTDAFTDEAIDFVEANKDRPFFLYLAHTAPHTPLQATAQYAARFPDIKDPHKRAYAAMVSGLDDNIGRLMAALKARGLERDTIVVFLSDNGCAHYVRGACTNKPLAGFKGMYWEGGIRVPFILSAPGRVAPGQVIATPVSSLDLMVTAARAAGAAPPAKAEGLDLIGLLKARGKAPERGLFWRTGPNYAVREGRWKLVVVNKTDDLDDPAGVYGSPTPDGVGAVISPLGQWVLLYDLAADPGEKVDLSARHPEVVKRLMASYRAWDANNAPPMWTSRRQFRTEVEGYKVQLYN
ncbi:sulfatase-like hydrolase/transferase [Caulobacter sp. SLTY]|uniref:sulfatase-like hydrolase/transferase n=1 Tax=Caulobacter sp. SLTY TaxID=2683262 RepID=UPI001412870F|nr:sulfatase-like hydrolase/transferase [Caulobacter sp. SLTY]NBB15183.1 sulfatase-like hydrolase/transferase [Caulobacter sp. SLTY]